MALSDLECEMSTGKRCRSRVDERVLSLFDTSALDILQLRFVLSYILHRLTLKSVFFYTKRRRC